MVLLAFVSLLAASCTSNDLGVIGTSDEGAISGKYNTILVVGEYMYAVNNSELITFDLSDDSNPQEINKQDVGRDIENIYHSENTLFIGSRAELHIYAINTDGVPTKKSSTEYVAFGDGDTTPCDPVVASQDVAYVTLSTSFSNFDDPCGSTLEVNELRAYNVQDLSSPQIMSIVPMHNPQGLSIDGDYLFVSDGTAGFSVFEVEHNGLLELVASIDGFAAYDLIAKDGKLLVVSPDEIRQYDYSDINDIRLYSSLSLR